MTVEREEEEERREREEKVEREAFPLYVDCDMVTGKGDSENMVSLSWQQECRVTFLPM